MQKLLSVILSLVLVLSLCVAAPVTASAKQDDVSEALAAAMDGGLEDANPSAVVKSLYNIITIMLTIDGLDIPQDALDIINQSLEAAKPVIENEECNRPAASDSFDGAFKLLRHPVAVYAGAAFGRNSAPGHSHYVRGRPHGARQRHGN